MWLPRQGRWRFGFTVNYQFDWEPILESRALILEGLATTILLSLCALALASIIGVIVGTLASSRHKGARLGAAAIVELTRNIPLLIHMYIWYVGLAFLRLPPFLCGVLGLSVYSGAYVAEIVRAGIASVPDGQNKAALATGLTRLQALLLVVYPQALRIVAPSLGNVFSQLIKDSSLASTIAVMELTYQASAIEGQTFRTFEIYITICALYLLLVSAVTLALRLLAGPRDDAPAQELASA
ncbi:MAG: amino acid ABC transporter permease [Hyphomicrobiales bacterium]|nr:amino acid ABC transporter permease [Hyphomicrobiales bacterium]